MVVVLPEAGRFEAFERDLNAKRLQEIFETLDIEHGRLGLPKFRQESTLDLDKVLPDMGIRTAFGPQADFGRLYEPDGKPNLQIGAVLHDAYVSIDERGTEAAGATGVEGQGIGMFDPFEMIVDRPFLFFIRDRSTNTVLYIGRIAKVTGE